MWSNESCCCCCCCFIIPYNSLANVVRLLAERSDTKSNVKLGRFRDPSFKRPTCLATLKSCDTTKPVCLWLTIYICLCVCIYIYIYLFSLISGLFGHRISFISGGLLWMLISKSFASYQSITQLLHLKRQLYLFYSIFDIPFMSSYDGSQVLFTLSCILSALSIPFNIVV